MKFFKKAKRGFTLVELVVVIAVIAILAAVSVGAYFGVTESANNSRLEQETKQIHTAIQTVALGNNSNAKLDSTGLTVDSAKTFETDLEKQTGTDLTVYKGEAPVIATPTIVLKETPLENSNGSTTVYKTYEYYQNEISGKKIITDVVTGKTKIDKTTVDFDSGAEIGEYVEIYFKNTLKNWDDNAHAHTFTLDPEDDTKVTASNGWPGDKATVVSLVDDIYKVEINTTYEYVIFNNGKTGSENGEQQMPRVEIPTIEQLKQKPYWDGDSWEAQPVIETDYATTGLTAYYSNSMMEEIYVYAYNRAGEYNNEWPGEKMELVKDRVDGLCSYTFETDYYRVIFNNGKNSDEGGIETNPIEFTGFSSSNNFYNGTEWSSEWPENVVPSNTYTIYFQNTLDWEKTNAYAWTQISETNSIENAPWPGESMVLVEGRESEKIYKLDVNKDLENIKFNGFGIDGIETSIPDEITEENCFFNGNEWTSLPIEDISSNLQSFEKNDIYLVGTVNWDDPRAHYWINDNGTAWPGHPMTIIEENVYKISVKTNFTNILFDNGSNPDGTKTSDISLLTFDPDYNYYHYDTNKWTNSNNEEKVFAPEYVTSSLYSIGGIINEEENWDNVASVVTNDGEKTIVFESDLTTDDEFKFKNKNNWDRSWGVKNGDVESATYLGESTDNIKVRFNGHYKFICDTTTNSITIETDVAAPGLDTTKENNYGLVGNFDNDSWNENQNHVKLSTINDGTLYKVEIDLIATQEFKVRKDVGWSNCYGYYNLYIPHQSKYEDKGGNIGISSATKYTIYFCSNTQVVYVFANDA